MRSAHHARILSFVSSLQHNRGELIETCEAAIYLRYEGEEVDIDKLNFRPDGGHRGEEKLSADGYESENQQILHVYLAPTGEIAE